MPGEVLLAIQQADSACSRLCALVACLGVELCHLLVIVRQLLLADMRVHHLLGEAGWVQQRACTTQKLSKQRV